MIIFNYLYYVVKNMSFLKHTTWSGSDAAKLVVMLLQIYLLFEVVFILSLELNFNDWFYNFWESGGPVYVIIIATILLSIVNGLYYNKQREDIFMERWGNDNKIQKTTKNLILCVFLTLLITLMFILNLFRHWW